jgi:hypothetical protein
MSGREVRFDGILRCKVPLPEAARDRSGGDIPAPGSPAPGRFMPIRRDEPQVFRVHSGFMVYIIECGIWHSPFLQQLANSGRMLAGATTCV